MRDRYRDRETEMETNTELETWIEIGTEQKGRLSDVLHCMCLVFIAVVLPLTA